MIIAIWIIIALLVISFLSITIVSILRSQEIESQLRELKIDNNNLHDAIRMAHKRIEEFENRKIIK